MNLHIKSRAIAALRELREFEAEAYPLANGLDEIVVLLDPRPQPRSSREMRERIRELRREREERDKLWRKKLLRKAYLRLAALLAAAVGMIATFTWASKLGDGAALIVCCIGVALLGFFYHEKAQGTSAIRAETVQEGVLDGGGGQDDGAALPGGL